MFIVNVFVVISCMALSVLSATSLNAQSGPRIDLRVPGAQAACSVSVRGVLADTKFDELMRNGFPVRLHFRTEVWQSNRWFDDPIGRIEWALIVKYDTFDATYEVARITADGVTILGTYKKLVDARAAAELPYSPTLPMPAAGRKGYVTVEVDVQTIDMSDLDEVQRWLRGEVRPAVQGKKNPGTALTRGLRQLVSRLLGGEVRHLETRGPITQ